MIVKVGAWVQRNISAVFEYCEKQDPAEFIRLQDLHYSKEVMGIYYPFCRTVAKIDQIETVRYWKQEYIVLGVPVRVSSQWFNPPTSNSLELFHKYLTDRQIPFEHSVVLAPNSDHTSKSVKREARGRYKMPAIGNGQNAVVRNILGSLGDEKFTAVDWEQVIADFAGCCAYCSNKGDLVMDHVVPINKKNLGEHRIGNLVPACRSCNAKKGSMDFRAFLSNNPLRIAVIEAHMDKYCYTPLGNSALLLETFSMAHAEVGQLADRYIALIEAILKKDEDIV